MPLKTTLKDLQEHIFAQLERLNDEFEMKEEKLEIEIPRARAVAYLAEQVININNLKLKAFALAKEYGNREILRDVLDIKDDTRQVLECDTEKAENGPKDDARQD
jgi:hypothetical protein